MLTGGVRWPTAPAWPSWRAWPGSSLSTGTSTGTAPAGKRSPAASTDRRAGPCTWTATPPWSRNPPDVTDPDTPAVGGRYDVLFEPVRIGPLTAKNRFFQVPHCNGMGYRDPSAEAAMRRAKAEGGWAVVCTEQVEIHPTSDITPFIELRVWDDQDIPALARIADAIHQG